MPIPIYPQVLPNGVSFDMIFVKGGTFEMGNEDEVAWEREKPVHKVQLDDFYICQYLVTQAVWKAAMKGENPSYFQGDHRPVETVSWNECQAFLKALNILAKDTVLSGYTYRLPTEAEWEYSARGGQLSKGYRYVGSDKLEEVGWYLENSDGETKPVGLLQPNELGFYDMSGNVDEWCEDDRHWNYNRGPKNGIAWIDKPARGDDRVIRGGSWNVDSTFCRSSSRFSWEPAFRSVNLGLRLVLSPPVNW